MRTQFKTQNLKVKTWALAVMVSLLLAPLTHATLISVNFASDATGGAVGNNIAGVVPAGNWNDITTSGSNRPLKDSTGATVLGLTFSGTTGLAGGVSAGGGGFASAGDNAMMGGYPYSSGTTALDLKFNGAIPYAMYNIYIYYNVGLAIPHDLIQDVSIRDGTGNSLGLSASVDQATTIPSSFIPWTGANTDGNYVEFAGLTSGSIPANFIIRAQGPSVGYPYGVINGLQIQEVVPEPSVALLAGTGALLLFLRRSSSFRLRLPC